MLHLSHKSQQLSAPSQIPVAAWQRGISQCMIFAGHAEIFYQNLRVSDE
jgi:hypothetical protein